MGRKIPAKKHRGVKDPIEQQARRLQSLKGKINAPPKDPDDQPVPQSLLRLFAFQNKTKDDKKNKSYKRKSIQDTTDRPLANPVTHLKQLPGESGRSFSLRINSAIKTINDPREDEDYPVELEAEDVKGEKMAARRERKRRKQKSAEEGPPKLSRAQKLAAKLKAKKEALKSIRPEVQYERVQFGDVTHAPPALTALPRHARRADGAARPGRRNLLLSAMLAGDHNAGAEHRQRERQEQERLHVVAAYREHKRRQRELTKTNARKHK